MLTVGGYDLVTRRRLQPAYIVGGAYVAAVQALALTLFVSPAWKPVAALIVGH